MGLIRFGHRIVVPSDSREQVYNGMDCVVPRLVAESIESLMDEDARKIYDFERACIAPALAMGIRGIRIDERERKRVLSELRKGITEKCAELDSLATEVWGKGLSPRSSKQLGDFFFDKLKVKSSNRSVDKEFLERTLNHPKAGRFAELVHDVRTLFEQAETLGLRKNSGSKAKILREGEYIDYGITDPDGRCRSTFNVGQTETGRWSTQDSPHRSGLGIHMVTKPMRGVFVPDPGCEMVYADLKTAESMAVAYYAGDEDYIDAHLTGDVHTVVCGIAWPEIAWTGDAKADRALAESTFMPWDRIHPLRFHAKKLQHGSNYLLSARGFARWAHIPERAAELAQARYFDTFPRIRTWHGEIRTELRATGRLRTPFGRVRHFLGRPWEEETVKEAVANMPQSLVGDILNTALLRVWYELDEGGPCGEIAEGKVQILAQAHDAILYQRRKGDRKALEAVRELMAVPIEIRGRTMTIPVDVKVGSNWKACS